MGADPLSYAAPDAVARWRGGAGKSRRRGTARGMVPEYAVGIGRPEAPGLGAARPRCGGERELSC